MGYFVCYTMEMSQDIAIQRPAALGIFYSSEAVIYADSAAASRALALQKRFNSCVNSCLVELPNPMQMLLLIAQRLVKYQRLPLITHYSFDHYIIFTMASGPVNHIYFLDHASSIALASRTIVNNLMGENIAIDAKVVPTNLTCISSTLAHAPSLSFYF